MKQRMSINKWYGRSIYIPHYEGYGFTEFVSSSFGIVRSIVQDQIGMDIRVQFTNTETAAADHDSKLIAINSNFLYGNFFPEEPGKPAPERVSSGQAIEVIMGLIVHEAAHFAHSPKELTPFREYVQQNTKCGFHPVVAGGLGNIVEDIFIEAEVDRTLPVISWMLESSNELFFDQSGIMQRIEEAYSISEPPKTLKEVATLMNFLILAKIEESGGSNPYLQELFALARSATKAWGIPNRYKLTLELYDRIMCNVQDAAEAEVQAWSIKMNGSGGQGNGETIVILRGNKKAEEAIKEAAKNARGLTAKSMEEAGGMGSDTYLTASGRGINQQINETMNVRIKILEDKGNFNTKTTMYIEKPALSNYHSLAMDERYRKLAEIGRQRATSNRPYGMDRQRGHNIRKLYRIGTDQKIFAESVKVSDWKPMQVIILIDCSGSMDSSVGHMPHSPTRINLAAKAGLGAAYGLSEARCEVAVYGHTAQTIGDDVCIYVGKHFHESMANLERKMGWMAGDADHAWNKDGYAIEYVGSKFTSQTKRRVLIVISDGQPNATGYENMAAADHTKGVVERLRQDKIDVFSISIEQESCKVNDYIYGAEFNVHNEDPNCISDILHKMFTQ